jgi:hypothetical protein
MSLHTRERQNSLEILLLFWGLFWYLISGWHFVGVRKPGESSVDASHAIKNGLSVSVNRRAHEFGAGHMQLLTGGINCGQLLHRNGDGDASNAVGW